MTPGHPLRYGTLPAALPRPQAILVCRAVTTTTDTFQVSRRCHGYDRDFPSVTTLSRLRPRLSNCHDVVMVTPETLQVSRRCHGYGRDSPSVTTLSRLRPRLSECHDAVTATTETLRVSRRCHDYDRDFPSVTALSRLRQHCHHGITATGVSTQRDYNVVILSCITTLTPTF